MLTIRLQRTGKKNASSFRIVVAEKTAHVSKKFKEVLGNYVPGTKAFIVKNPERIQYWISQHVEVSPTVHNLFVDNGLIQGAKVKAFSIPKKEVAAEPAGSSAAQPDASDTKEEAPPESAPESETPAA